MALLRKNTQLFVVLLVLVTGAVLVVPAGVHLAFCFGSDGHMDLTMDVCPDGPAGKMSAALSADESVTSVDHHNECLDTTLVCKPAMDLVLPGGKTGLFKTALQKDPGADPALLAVAITAPPSLVRHRTGPPVVRRVLPSPHLVSCRTTVLLI